MSRSEGFTSSWDVLLDRHIRISESNETYFVTIFSKDCKFFGLTGCPLGLIISTKTLATIIYAHFFLRL